MILLKFNSFARKGFQFINAMNEYSQTHALPPNFMKKVLDKLHIRDGYVMDVLEYGDSYGRECRFYAHKAATKGIYKGDYESGCRKTYTLFSSIFSDDPQTHYNYSIEEYRDDMLIDGYLSKEAESRVPIIM